MGQPTMYEVPHLRLKELADKEQLVSHMLELLVSQLDFKARQRMADAIRRTEASSRNAPFGPWEDLPVEEAERWLGVAKAGLRELR
jgi:hypothetical protein